MSRCSLLWLNYHGQPFDTFRVDIRTWICFQWKERRFIANGYYKFISPKEPCCLLGQCTITKSKRQNLMFIVDSDLVGTTFYRCETNIIRKNLWWLRDLSCELMSIASHFYEGKVIGCNTSKSKLWCLSFEDKGLGLVNVHQNACFKLSNASHTHQVHAS